MSKLLILVKKTNPILRQIMPAIHDFDDPELHETIKDMCYSILPEQLKASQAPHESAAGMAANQWGLKKRIFIYTPDGSDASKRLDVMINPSYLPYHSPTENEVKMVAAYEGCFSIPLTTGLINRYESIMATYYNVQGDKITRILHGWEARVFQHETDHLNGKLFDGQLDHYDGPECLERIIFKDVEEMDNFWINKVRPSRKKASDQ